MWPLLIDLGSVDLPGLGPTRLILPTYGVLFAGSVLLAWTWFMRRARSLGLPEERLFNLTFYTLLAGIIGAKALLILIDWRRYLAHPEEIWGTVRAAGVLMGGVAAGALVFFWYARRHRLPLFALVDAAVAPVALAQAIGRLGCFAAGCCWGKPSQAAWAVTFHNADAHAQTGVPLGDPRTPVQLIQSAHDLILAAVLTWLWRRRPQPDGTVFWIYVLVYSIGRSLIELLRGDKDRGMYFGERLSTSQLLSVLAATLAVVMLARGWARLRGAARG